MHLGETQLYQKAIAALSALKESGDENQLKAIAEFMLYAHDSAVPESLFPYVGDRTDPRDQAIVTAYKEAWTRFVSGEYDESDSFPI